LVGVLEKTNQISLASFLEGPNCGALEAHVSLELLGNFSDETLEGELALWPQIAAIHQIEITQLQTRINTFYLTLPKPEHQTAANEFSTMTNSDPYNFQKWAESLTYLPLNLLEPPLLLPQVRTTPKVVLKE
jgi:hypothetical protein